MKRTVLFLALAGAAPAVANEGTMTITRQTQEGEVTVYRFKSKMEPSKDTVKTTPLPRGKAAKPKASPEEWAEAWRSPGCQFMRRYVTAERAKEMLACRPWQSAIQ